MPRIKKLAPEEISKIAAGEVVERPANVVKELIENALDAQATEITVRIAQGGKQSIQIIDNGCGMDAEDARNCFEHHATSKLTSVLDLPQVNTFGFRGEALSSIAAVSQVTLVTKQPNSLEGIKLSLAAGVVTSQESTSCNIGSSITVQSLFFNIPARKKFLRSNETEWHQILQLFQSFALNYPEISWTLYHNDSLTHRCPPVSSLAERALQLWDPSLGNHILPISYAVNGISIEGIISDHQYHRFDRSRIFFFTNRRWVKNQQLGRALVRGYANVLPHGKYPFACVSISVPPAEVDINVHPRKEEVQFAHPRMVEQAIQMTVQAALQNKVSRLLQRQTQILPDFSDDVFGAGSISKRVEDPARPEQDGSVHFAAQNSSTDALASQTGLNALVLSSTKSKFTPEPVEGSKNQSAKMSLSNPQDERGHIPPSNNPDTLLTADSLLSFETHNLIGQFNDTYILLDHPNGLLIVDQHAAHERILFERFLQRFDEQTPTKLVFPQVVQMSSEDISVLTQYLPVLQAEGIEIEQVGAAQLIVTALPMASKRIDIQDLLKELVSWVYENQNLDREQLKLKIIHQMRAMMACKAAVKAGDKLSKEQIDQLLVDLQAAPNRLTCPHGRPTSWLLNLSEIERKFKRRV